MLWVECASLGLTVSSQNLERHNQRSSTRMRASPGPAPSLTGVSLGNGALGWITVFSAVTNGVTVTHGSLIISKL